MIRSRERRAIRLRLRPACVLALTATLGSVGVARSQTQIVRDGSFAGAPVVASDGFGVYEIDSVPAQRVGSAGRHLIHSFDLFDVGEGDTARFLAPAGVGPGDIRSVIARVTGPRSSQIDGAIDTDADLAGAHLFLLNPHGVLFGDGASVDLDGSLSISTADALEFEDEGGSSTGALPVAAVPPSGGWASLDGEPGRFVFRGGRAGAVRLGGEFYLASDSAESPGWRGDLTVAAGSVEIAGGAILKAGDCEAGCSGSSIASLATLGIAAVGEGAAEVPVLDVASATFDVSGLDLRPFGDTLGEPSPGDVRIGRGAELATVVQDVGQGRIVLRGGRLTIAATARLDAAGMNEDAPRNAIDVAFEGDVAIGGLSAEAPAEVLPDFLYELQSGWIDTEEPTGGIRIEAGQLTLNATKLLTLTGSAAAGGSIVVEADRVALRNGARLETTTFGEGGGRAGAIEIEAADVELTDGSQITTSTLGRGDAGAITLDLGDTGRLMLRGSEDATTPLSGLFARSGVNESDTRPLGDSGPITITAGVVEVLGGAQVSTAAISPGSGAAAPITITAGELVRIGEGFGRTRLSNVATDARNEQSGLLSITTSPEGRIEVTRFGRIASKVLGSEDAQGVELRAGEIRVAGEGARINAQTELGGDGGASGRIELVAESGDLVIADGADVNASTDGSGAASSIVLRADRGDVRIESGATVLAEARGAGQTADVEFEAPNGRVVVSGGARVDAGAVVGSVGEETGAGSIVFRGGRGVEIDGGVVETVSGARAESGDITLSSSRVVRIVSNARVETTLTTAEGTGGTIDVNAPLVVVDASRVYANANGPEAVFAGDVVVTAANGAFLSATADLQARASTAVNSGSVLVQSPDTTPIAESTAEEVAFRGDADELAEGCLTRRTPRGSLRIVVDRPPLATPQGPLRRARGPSEALDGCDRP